MLSVPSLFLGLLALPTLLSAAPIPISTLRGRDFQPRATACFITGSVALPAEVEASVAPLLAAPVTCNSAGFAFATVPDVVSGGVDYSTIDFQKSSSSPRGFALGKFTNLDLTVLQNQLNVYLAVEAGTRSLGGTAASAFLGKLKSPKFFLQFQIARVNEANGVAVGAAGTVAHQLQKVQKNSAGATAAELAQLLTLSTTIPSASTTTAVAATVAVAAPAAFSLQKYADFQISSDTAGTALAKAKLVFVVPGGNAATVSQADIKSLATMRSAAEAAETDFNSAIAAAGGTGTTAGAALQVGKIQNKVLKLFGLAQINTIKLAQGGGADVQAAFGDASTKLAANVKLDTAAKGKATTAIPTSPAAATFA